MPTVCWRNCSWLSLFFAMTITTRASPSVTFLPSSTAFSVSPSSDWPLRPLLPTSAGFAASVPAARRPAAMRERKDVFMASLEGIGHLRRDHRPRVVAAGERLGMLGRVEDLARTVHDVAL